jgi:hypothetical protein
LQPRKKGIATPPQQEEEQSEQALSSPPSSSPLLLRQTNPVQFAYTYLNSPETQRQYSQRLKHFFDHVGLPGRTIEEQGQAFLDEARENKQWAEEKILLFLDSQKQRVLKKEFAVGTSRNLFLAIKTRHIHR